MSTTTTFERSLDRCLQLLARLPSAVLIFVLVLWSFARQALHRVPDVDLFTRFAVGRLILTTGEAPHQDPFSFSTTLPVWHDHELLSGLMYFLVWRESGFLGIWLLKIAFITATTWLLWQAAESEKTSRPSRPVLLGVLGLLILSSHAIWLSTLRAHAFTFLFFAWFLLVFRKHRLQGGGWWLASLPAVTVVWVNAHGGLLAGVGFAGMYCAIRTIENRKIAWGPLFAALGSAAALVCTPYGVSYLHFLFNAVRYNPSAIPTDPPSVIPEWLPLSLVSLETALVSVLAILMALGMRSKGQKISSEGAAFLLLSACVGIRYQRFLPFFYFTVAAYGIPVLQAGWSSIQARLQLCSSAYLARALLITAGVLSILALCTGVRFFALRHYDPDLSQYPEQEVNWIAQHLPGGRILNHYNQGSYLLWSLSPRFLVSLDGRFDGVYPLSTIQSVHLALRCGDPRQLQELAAINPDIVFIDHELVYRPECFPGYREVLHGPRARVLTRALG